MTTKEKIRREEVARENLNKRKNFDGVIGTATVTDVVSEFEDSDMLVEFEIELPDKTVGYLRFSDYSSNHLDTFVQEELQTSYSEFNVIEKKFPVIKTRNGWKTEIGNAPLRYVFQPDEESWAFNVNDMGIVTPNSKIKYAVLILSFLPALKFGLFWIVLATSYLGFGLLSYISIVAMLSPISRDVQRESLKD